VEFSSNFIEKVVLLVGGFLLTSAAGTVIAATLQNRSWEHRWKVQRDEERVAAARNVFEEVSRLMDRRLFRVSQLCLWCNRGDEERIKYALESYRDVLAEWNESINRNLSMLQFYFDQKTREQFDFGVGKKFVDVGALVENHPRLKKERDISETASTDGLLSELRHEVYDFNLAMLQRIENRQLVR
jgi:hypothetical protein